MRNDGRKLSGAPSSFWRCDRDEDRTNHSTVRHWIVQFFGIALLVLLWGGVVQAQERAPDPDPSTFNIVMTGDSSVDRFYGEFSERIPIALPAVHGLEPKLALHYHSGDGNGPVGWGWSL